MSLQGMRHLKGTLISSQNVCRNFTEILSGPGAEPTFSFFIFFFLRLASSKRMFGRNEFVSLLVTGIDDKSSSENILEK